MRKSFRLLIGLCLGIITLGTYIYSIGASVVVNRITAVASSVAVIVFLLVVVEGVVDGLGVWASIAPLGEGLNWHESIQFALAGDFFDILSPTGPVGSEPVMARFYSVKTDTGYADALGVRSSAKYIKSGAQIFLSSILGFVIALESPSSTLIIFAFCSVTAILLVVGFLTIRFHNYLSIGLVAILTPVVNRLSLLYRENPYDKNVVTGAVDRYWERVMCFRQSPQLIFIIAIGGILEQVLTAAAIGVTLITITGNIAPLYLIFLIPFPQVARIFPIPGSLGAYDLLLVGVIVFLTSTSETPATAAVLMVRTFMLLFGASVGGLCVSTIKGWKPS